MLQKIAMLALAAPRRIIGIAVLFVIGATILGLPVAKSLSAGGFYDPASESSRASRLLMDTFGHSDQQLVLVVSADTGVDSDPARDAAMEIVEHLRQSPVVLNVSSAWTVRPEAAAAMVSKDGNSGLIVADLMGGENNAQKYAKTLADEVVYDRNGVTVRAGGSAMVYSEVTDQSERDLVLMESIALPLSFIALVWIFGGLFAAALPTAVGVIAIVGSTAILRVITFSTDVSIVALNLTTALGLALAIDYTLLIVSRYREELARGVATDQALIRTMATAGRTVIFSATTVALSMAVMVLFPMFFLKSSPSAGVPTVPSAAAGAIVVTPAVIVVLGPRLSHLDVRRLVRQLFGRAEPAPKPVQDSAWYRSTKFVMRRAVPIGVVVVAGMLLLGGPFLGVKWGFSDDRLLPRSASAHQVGDQLREEFASDAAAALYVAVPNIRGVTLDDIDHYASALSQLPDVASVSAPSGIYAGGRLVSLPSEGSGMDAGSAFLTISSTAPLYSQASEDQLDRVHAVPGPADRPVEVTGLAQSNRDSVDAITARLPLVLGLIAVITFALLFLLTGSVVMPIKALVLNVLSLTATFGALVWIFQDGHLGALGTASTGTLIANMPILLFCIAFGLSMDYEVFLMARIREYWLGSARTDSDNEETVALGVARTGRVITAAAAIMAISFAALTVSQVSFMRMFGLGLTIAILMDATLVRTVLVPAFMRVMGRANWWAPKPLAVLHDRVLTHVGEDFEEDHSSRPGAPLPTPGAVAHEFSARG